MNLSKKMKEALLNLYDAPKCTGYVQMKTSEALEDRGLKHVTGGQSTGSDRFPSYMGQLTVEGYRYCLKNF